MSTENSGSADAPPSSEGDILHRMQTTVGGQFLITVTISRISSVAAVGPVLAPSSAAAVTAAAVTAATALTAAAPGGAAPAAPITHRLMLGSSPPAGVTTYTAPSAAAMNISTITGKKKRQTRHCKRCGVQGCPGGYQRKNCPRLINGLTAAEEGVSESTTHVGVIDGATTQSSLSDGNVSLAGGSNNKPRKPRTCYICGSRMCPGKNNRLMCHKNNPGLAAAGGEKQCKQEDEEGKKVDSEQDESESEERGEATQVQENLESSGDPGESGGGDKRLVSDDMEEPSAKKQKSSPTDTVHPC